MTRDRFHWTPLLFAGLLAAGCGRSEAPPPAASDSAAADETVAAQAADPAGWGASARELGEAADSLKKAAPVVGAELGEAMQAMSRVVAQSENSATEPVDFRTLKTLLPESLAGFARREAPSGERQMGVSSATGEFGDDDGRTLSVKIIDTGAMRAMLAGGAAMAMSLDLDKETADGYERNTVIRGHKAREKREGDDAEVTLLVADRFLVELHSSGLTDAQIKSALQALPLDPLAGLNDQGVRPAGAAK